MLPLMPEKGATLKAPQDSKVKVFSTGYVTAFVRVDEDGAKCEGNVPLGTGEGT
jgi:hypothetical protein